MKIIWQGTDSLYLVKFPKYLKWTKIFYVLALRVFAKISDVFTMSHLACGQLTENNLKRFGVKKPIYRFKDLTNYGKVRRIPHGGFNVLYYYPKNDTTFNRWLYGKDIFNALTLHFKDINFIVVNGDQDLNEVYPIVDLLIRPNRHDGHPRMVDECKINGIPYVWTNQNPTIEYFIESIEKLLTL